MTSNVGSRQLKDFGNDIGFTFTGNDSKSKSQEIIKKALNKQFSPEFLNRIDEIITFEPLNFDSIKSIVHLELNMLKTRLKNLGIELVTTDETVNFIAEKGYDKQFGARPIKRSLQTYIEDVITDMIVEGEITSDMVITAKLDKVEGKIVFEIND
jgi:ATP-dependent Clp protease ATP-binding subunit ClpC